MIEVYLEIADALACIPGLEMVDIAPRVAEQTNLYPAAYISIDDIPPLNAIGGSTLCDLRFSVEIWLKPYQSSRVKPRSPALAALADNLEVVNAVRKAIFNLEGDWVRSTTMEAEVMEKQPDGFYKVMQRWLGTTAYTLEEGQPLADPPEVVFG